MARRYEYTREFLTEYCKRMLSQKMFDYVDEKYQNGLRDAYEDILEKLLEELK